MATEQKVITNLTAGQKAVFPRLNKQVCVFNGYDKPRYFDKNGRAGYLGLEAWTDDSFKLTGVAGVTGTLGNGKFFSCVAVPIDTRYSDVNGRYRMGNPTVASDAVEATSEGQQITWTLPLAHTQSSSNIYSSAFLTGGGSATAVIGTWTVVNDGSFNITIDGTVRSVTALDFSADTDMDEIASTIQAGIRALTAKYETVTWSTDHFIVSSGDTSDDSAITVTSAQGAGTDISGAGGTPFMDSEVGNGVVTNALTDVEADTVYLYCSQASPSAELAETGTKYFIGSVDNVAGETLEMTADPTTSVSAVETNNFQPPTFSYSVVMNDRIFGIVGETEARGQIQWSSTNTQFEGKSYGAFVISSITDQGNDIWRYTFSGTPDLSDIAGGMRMTCASATDSDNDVELTTVWDVSDASDYIDVRNDEGVAQGGAGGLCNVFETYIGEGFSGANFRFEADGVAQDYIVDEVDYENQTFTVVETTYNGLISSDTFTDFVITTHDKRLWYSKLDDPNTYPATNTLQFEEELTGLSTAGEQLAVFSLTSVYIVNPRNPLEYRKTHSPVGTPAKFSTVPTENGVYFFDGTKFRLFDGYNSTEFTSRRVARFMEGLNPALKHLVHGIYIPSERVVKWFVPYGSTTATMNYWVEYHLNSGFWWYGRSVDATFSTVIEEPTSGETVLYTGSSARYTDKGFVNKWFDSDVDGLDSTTTTIWGTVTNVVDASNQLSFSVGAGLVISTNDIGVPCQVIDSGGTRDILCVVETIVDNGGGNYTITYHDDFDLSSVVVGDWVVLGSPAFTYGIKWMDFGSPQYLHELKEIHLDATAGDYTWGLVDFYTDYDPSSKKTVAFSFASGETKRVVRFHGQRGYQVGFKIRAWSQGKFEVKDIVSVHRTIV